MKNMTPMILGLLMLTSLFAGIDFTELEETVVIEEAGARAGADPSVLAITSPKETVCDNTGCRNELKVGEATNFAAYIQNLGDAPVDELSYTVTVYLTDSSGTVGMIAKDTTGNDLQWVNLDAICDDGSVCDFDSTATPHPFPPTGTPPTYLGGGKYTLQLGGQDIVWTPTQGTYIVDITVNSPTDADIANNGQQVAVTVTDWYDIKVEMEWDDGSTTVTGSGASAFTLTVTADGSSNFAPRDVQIRLGLTGNVASATGGANNDDITLNSGITMLTAGTEQTVVTFQNESDLNDTTSDLRHILDYQTSWTYGGLVTPDGTDATSKFDLTATLIDYVLYGQYPDCVESFTVEENLTTWAHFCEVSQTGDDRPATDSAEISGAVENYHDIRISRMGVYQGYNSDGTGQASNFIEDSTGADLNVGFSRVYAELQHRGSDVQTGYDWNVSYTISLGTTVMSTGIVNDCMQGIDMPYQYQPLGGPGMEIATVCVEVSLAPGEYTFEFDLVMENKSYTIGATGAVDMRTGNNDRTMVSNVVNNLPLITSFEVVTQGDLIVGQEDELQFAVSAFDVDDPSGVGLNFVYNIVGGTIAGCESKSMLVGGTTCTTLILRDFVTDFPVTVVVTDSHGGEVSKELILSIWNDASPEETTASGIKVSYPLQYMAKSNFTLTTTDGDLTSYEGVELEGFSGSYDAVGVVDYAPSTTFVASDILTQSLKVTVPKALDATSLWYIDSSGKWIQLDNLAEDDVTDASMSVFNYAIPANSGVIPAGVMVLMGGELVGGAIPTAAISGFVVEAQKAGAIGMSWEIDNLPLRAGDAVRLIITNGTAEVYNQTMPEADRSTSYPGTSTTHGVTYFATIAVCNEEGCSTSGLGNATADKQVDGDASATELSVQAVNDNWVVSWTVNGDSSDVAMWHVCFAKGNGFTAANMPTDCPDMVAGADGKTVTIAIGTKGSGEYHFTAVPMDALGNMDTAASMNSISYVAPTADTNASDDTIGDDPSDSAAGGIPTGAWAAIGGVVIVAFVVGAFILTRGDDEEGGSEDGKDWDY